MKDIVTKFKYVKFDGDPDTPYDPNLIDNMEVRRFLSKHSFVPSEYWGWAEDGDNGYPYYDFGSFNNKIAWESSKDFFKIYLNSAVEFGAVRPCPWNYMRLEFARREVIVRSEYLSHELHVNPPTTMRDVMEAIETFCVSFHLKLIEKKQDTRVQYCKGLLSNMILHNDRDRKTDYGDIPF